MYIFTRITLLICSIYTSSSTYAFYNTKNNTTTRDVDIINISQPVQNVILLQLPEIIEWNYWNYKAIPTIQLETNAVDMVSLINTKNIVIDRIYLCKKSNKQTNDYKIISEVGYNSAILKQKWQVPQMDNVQIHAIGYQISLQKWVARSKPILINGSDMSIPNNKLSVNMDAAHINSANIPIRFEWKKDAFKVDQRHGSRSYKFAIKFNNQQTVSEADLLSEQYPNLFFLLGYKVDDVIHKWEVKPNNAKFIKQHQKHVIWSVIRYNNYYISETDWYYKPSNYTGYVVKIFAYDANEQRFIGCTTKWNLTAGIHGIEEWRRPLIDIDSSESSDRVADDVHFAQPVPYYQIVRNMSGFDVLNPRLIRNRLEATAPRRLPLKIVTLICVGTAILILGVILLIMSIQKKRHERKLEQQIAHVNDGRNMKIIFEPRLDCYSVADSV